jgi:glycosyltransferase involved in cell wall biosynthesis
MSNNPIRVLHVHSHLERGGVETWLTRVLPLLDPGHIRFDFAVHKIDPVIESGVRGHGALIHPTSLPRHPHLYWHEIYNIARRGRYDILHCHFFEHSGYAMLAGHQAGVPVRIAHSHLDVTHLLPNLGVSWKAYWALSRRLLDACATAGLAASGAAAESMFGTHWQSDSRWRVLPCGIDLAPLRGVRGSPARALIRHRFGFSDSSFVIGHIGRFTAQKNHSFLPPIVRALVDGGIDANLLLVGEGPLESETRAAAAAHGIAGRVHFHGATDDVASPLAAMDAFAFPSTYEGLGLAVVEAQAASLPCVVSDAVPAEAAVVPGLYTRLPLSDVGAWVAALRAACARGASLHSEENWRRVAGSVFEIKSNTSALLSFYENALARTAVLGVCA